MGVGGDSDWGTVLRISPIFLFEVEHFTQNLKCRWRKAWMISESPHRERTLTSIFSVTIEKYSILYRRAWAALNVQPFADP